MMLVVDMKGSRPFSPVPENRDDANQPDLDGLQYRIHLWDERGQNVELLLAVTLHQSIAYAALYAAAKEWPQRPITISHRGEVVYRWDSQPR